MVVEQNPSHSLSMSMGLVSDRIKYRLDVLVERTYPMGISLIDALRYIKEVPDQSSVRDFQDMHDR